MKRLKTPAKVTLGFRPTKSMAERHVQPLLVTIFLRGGADGLSLVAPYQDDGYYRNRVVTALPKPGTGTNTLVDLDGFFGLHRALSPLLPLYSCGQLAIIHACGSGDQTLSHFAAANTVERGLFQGESESSGWIARFLDAAEPSATTGMKAVSISALLPASLDGCSCAVALQSLADLSFNDPFAGTSWNISETLRQLYSGNDYLSQAGQQSLSLAKLLARSEVKTRQPKSRYADDDLGKGLQQIAQLVSFDAGLSTACIDQTGYDTHVVQGSTDGQLAACLATLAKNVNAFIEDLGPHRWRHTKIVVMSEFGRRIHENDGGGTDHGHGGVMMVLGGSGVAGGKVFGHWPGLESAGTDENGNLQVTTDYRNVLAEVIAGQIGLVRAKSVFPALNYSPVGVVPV